MSAEARRDQILDITHAIVAAEDFHAATPNRIADAAGINRSLLYQQFGDLGGLFVALIDRESDRAASQFARAIEAATEAEDDPAVRAFDGVLTALDAHPETWRLFLIPPRGAPPVLYERLERSQAVVRAHFIHGLLQLNPKLEDPEYTARVLQAASGELLRLRLTDPESATRERLHAMVCRLRDDVVRR